MTDTLAKTIRFGFHVSELQALEYLSTHDWQNIFTVSSILDKDMEGFRVASLLIDAGKLIALEAREIGCFERFDVFRISCKFMEDHSRNILDTVRKENEVQPIDKEFFLGGKVGLSVLWATNELQEELSGFPFVSNITYPTGFLLARRDHQLLVQLDVLPTWCRLSGNPSFISQAIQAADIVEYIA